MLKEADAEVFGMLVMKMTTGADGRVRSAEFTCDCVRVLIVSSDKRLGSHDAWINMTNVRNREVVDATNACDHVDFVCF